MHKTSKAEHESAVKQYFRNKADSYDLVENQAYWRLSDALLWEMLSRLVSRCVPETFNFLDAGGGTGRWSERLLEAFPKSCGETFDISLDMLTVAEAKRAAGGKSLQSRWKTCQGDLHDLHKTEKFDLVICFHNVLGFVWSSDIVLSNLVRALKPNGYLAVVVPNKFHGIFFNLSLHNLEGAESISANSLGVFTDNMPLMDFFDADDIRSRLSALVLNEIQIRGFPLFLYPGYSETQLSGQTSSLGELLESSTTFNRIFSLEKKYSDEAAAAWRGNNLFVSAHKSADHALVPQRSDIVSKIAG